MKSSTVIKISGAGFIILNSAVVYISMVSPNVTQPNWGSIVGILAGLIMVVAATSMDRVEKTKNDLDDEIKKMKNE